MADKAVPILVSRSELGALTNVVEHMFYELTGDEERACRIMSSVFILDDLKRRATFEFDLRTQLDDPIERYKDATQGR